VPKRTNTFQEAVAIVHRHLAPELDIEESYMLRDLVDDEEREVDTVITASAASYKLVISIEASAQRRPAARPWVEQQIKKHETLPTNLLVLVSESGFSRPALRLAERSNVATITPETLATPKRDYQIVTRLSSVWSKVASLTPTAAALWIEIPTGTALFPSTEDTLVRLVDSTPVGTLREVLGGIIEGNLNTIVQQMGIAEIAKDLDTTFEMAIDNPAQSETIPGLFVEAGPGGSTLRRISPLEAQGTAIFRVAEVPLRHVRLGETDTAYGEAKIAGRSALLVVTESAQGGKATIRVRPKK
jgi:hypothetical protein